MKLRRYIGSRAFYGRMFSVMIPVLIQNVITNFVNLIDNVMVGQVGTEQMAGVAIVNQLIFVFNLFIFGGMAGPGIFTAQFYGKGDEEGVRRTFRLKLYLAVIGLAAFSAVFFFKGDALISLFLHDDGEGLDLAATACYAGRYLRVIMLQLVPFAMVQAYSSTLRETGQTVVPMTAGIAAVLINVFFNWVLIFGKLGAPVLGVEGAAIATVIARFAECAAVIIYTHTHSGDHPFIKGAYASARVPGELVKSVVVMGFPLLMNELLWSSGMTVLQQTYSIRGISVVSAVSISSTVSNLFFCAFFAMGSTVSIMIGQLLGAGELERAVDEDRKLIAFSVALCAAVGAVMYVVAPLIPEIYKTTDNVKLLASELLRVVALLMPIHGFVNAAYFTLRSGGKTLITFLFDSAYVWVINVPVSMILANFTAMPILPLYTIVQLTDLIKVASGLFLVRSRKWVNNLVK